MSREFLPNARQLSQWHNSVHPNHILAGSLSLLWVEFLVRRPATLPLAPWQDLLKQIQHLNAQELQHLLGLDEPHLTGLLNRPPPPETLTRERLCFRCGQVVPLADVGPFEWNGTAHQIVPASQSFALVKQHCSGKGVELVEGTTWQAIPWEQVEHRSAVLLVQAEQVQGYWVVADRLSDTPDFSLAMQDTNGFPEIGQLTVDELQQGWQSWAKSRSVPEELSNSTTLSYFNGELKVGLGEAARNWLQANRADAFSSEIWLWIGHGELKHAARLTFSE